MQSFVSVRFKGCVSFLKTLENSKRYCGKLPYCGNASHLYQRMLMGLNISPSIWQSYINAILDCLQSRNIVRQ